MVQGIKRGKMKIARPTVLNGDLGDKVKIEKKCWPEFFGKILNGEKTFELRLADFECQTGDILVLRERDPRTKNYTGRQVEKTVSFVLKTKDLSFWPKEVVDKYGYMVMGLR
jgi:ribosomal protein S17